MPSIVEVIKGKIDKSDSLSQFQVSEKNILSLIGKCESLINENLIDENSVVMSVEYFTGTGGGNQYFIRKAIDNASRPQEDGGSIIHLNALTEGWYLEGVFPYGIVTARQFGAKGDKTNDDYEPIVNALAFSDSVYLQSGEYLVSDAIHVGNKRLYGDGIEKTYIYSNFSGSQYCVVSIGKVGWSAISDIIFGGSIEGVCIRRNDSTLYTVGLLVTGTRNAYLERVKVQNHRIGYFVENTSELVMDQVSDIASYWSFVFDNRGSRSAAERPGGFGGNTDNDVSSLTFIMTKSYFSQHAGVVAMNCGTLNANGMTIGRFSDNPETGTTPYGLPLTRAGFHAYGLSTKWTRNSRLSGLVFEASGTGTSLDCIVVESTTTNNPVSNFTIDSCEVQTYDNDHDGGVVTTLLRATTNGVNTSININMVNSGFTNTSSGFTVGNLFNVDDRVNLRIGNVFPLNSISSSKGGRNVFVDENYTQLHKIAIHGNASSGLGVIPDDWVAIGDTATYLELVKATSATAQYVRLSGGSASEMGMYLRQYYRTYKWQDLVPFIKVVHRGEDNFKPVARVNIQSDTYTSQINGTNKGRYGNALYCPDNDNNIKVSYLCFPEFSAGTDFDVVDIILSINTTDTAYEVDILDVEVGFIEKYEDLNVFS